MNFNVTVALLTVVLSSSSSAMAHDGPLAGVDIRERNGHVLIVNSFGLLQSQGDGQPWTWMCEAAYGSGAVFEHEFEMSKRSEAIFVTSVDGLLVSRDGCSYGFTSLGDKFISTIAQADNGDLFAAAVDGDGSKIYRSTDDGMTFGQASNGFRNFDTWRSIKFAPSAPTRIYITGVRVPAGMPRSVLVYRSDDGGNTFTTGATTGVTGIGSNSTLFIAGVSPTNPDLVYARLTLANGGDGDDLYRSTDAGMTWTKVLSRPETMKVVVRRNGELIVGTEASGTVRSTDGVTFAPIPTAPTLQCLVELANGTLYGCTQNFGSDGAAVKTSTDGDTWTALMQYGDIAGPAECADGTMQVDYCIPTEWCELAEDLTVESSVCRTESDESAGCCDTRSRTSPAILPVLLLGLLLRGRSRRR